ncbi:MAG: hypothetical protein Q4E51_04425 [Lachnospiraceae bacterium]|nr:hypothetical protein [Lachnospiraceae bacterium]
MTFLSTFVTYLIIAIGFLAIIVCGVFAGKKLRENKDAKASVDAASDKENN